MTLMYISNEVVFIQYHSISDFSLQTQAELFRNAGGDVDVEIICNGLLALQGRFISDSNRNLFRTIFR